MTMLSDLPVGAVFSFGAVVTGQGAFDLLSKDNTVQAHVTVDPVALTLAGTLTQPPTAIPVQVVSAPFAINDVISDDNTGALFVVRDVWLSPTGFCWSNTTSRAAIYSTTGFTKVGTATVT